MRKFFTYDDAVVPVHHPLVVVQTAVAQGADRSELLRDTGLTADMLHLPETRISYLQFALLAGNALRLTNNPALGLDVGRNLGVPQLGMLGLAIASSPTLGDALAAALRHYRSLTPAWHFDFRIEGERAYLTLREGIRLWDFKLFVTEVTLTAFQCIGSALYGQPLPTLQLRLQYSKPAHAQRYAELIDAPILYDQTETECTFEASVLQAKLAHADPATAKLADRYCAQLATELVSTEGLVEQVRMRLDATLNQPPNVEELAHELQTSTRSLRRFLRMMGSSYEELLDTLRRQRADQLVQATRLPLKEIARQVGFGNARSFNRAFKRWTGHTPSALRRQP